MAREVPFGNRILEIVAVMLLGLATVGTAWCGLQSSLWNGEQDQMTVVAESQRSESSRMFGLATQQMAYDAAIVADYAQAVAERNDNLRQFYRNALIRKGFAPYLDKWEADVASGRTPVNLLENAAYLTGLLGPYEDKLATAVQTEKDAARAGRISDLYVLTTVLLAVSLFFAGVTSSFRSPTLRLVLLLSGLATMAIAAGRLVDLPVAQTTVGLLTG